MVVGSILGTTKFITYITTDPVKTSWTQEADRHYRYPNVSGIQREHCIPYNSPLYPLMECHHAIEMHHTYADH